MRTLLVFIALMRTVVACSCGPGSFTPICQRIGEARVLFIGTAVATNDRYDGPIEGGIWYRFTVEETFKGLQPRVREVLVETPTPCPMSFAIGKQYVVFGFSEMGEAGQASDDSIGLSPAIGGSPRLKVPVVETDICSAREVKYVSARDLGFARQYREAPRPPSVVGSARIHADEFYWSDSYPPLPGALITLNGPGVVRTASTGTDGRYEFPDVQPGNYRVTAWARGFASHLQSYDVHVPAQGCGVANVGMFTDGSMSGKVLEQHGRPARYVTVEYRYSDPELMDTEYYRSTRTNDLGEFRFAGVPPGDLLLGVHIDSAPIPAEGILPTYWPGVTDRERAQIIRMAAGEKKENLVLKLGLPAAIRVVRIKLQRSDGRPLAGVTVWASVHGDAASSVTANGEGAAEMSLMAGVAYSFSARAQLENPAHPSRGWVDTEPAVLPPGTLPAEVVLVFKKPGTEKE